MISPQFILPLHSEIVVDNFAGGGGASTGIELAIGRHVDVALNHDPRALSMHRMNHPQTIHYCEDIRVADPVKIVAGRPVGLVWFSPDCKHFSKAKGGRPRDKKIRGLAWVVINWVNKVSPRIIILENVEEFQTWGPIDNLGNPKKSLSGFFFKCFVGALIRRGYKVEYRELRACDYGAPTIRKRFFLIARRDGKPIVWAEPTHGQGCKKPYKPVSECIDFTIPCQSIFLSQAKAKKLHVKRPLANATLDRIAKGIDKFILKEKSPFVVGFSNGENAEIRSSFLTRYNQGATGCNLKKPVNTIAARSKLNHDSGGNGFGLVECRTAFISHAQQGGANRDIKNPIHTICASSKDQNQVVCCFIAQQNGGWNTASGRSAKKPISTLLGSGSQQQLVACALATNTTGHAPRGLNKPISTLTTGGQQILLSAAIVPYYGNEKDGQSVQVPCRTLTTKERFAMTQVELEYDLMTPEKEKSARKVAKFLRSQGVVFDGEFACVGQFIIWDIGLRMLKPRECYLAQGFPKNYIIDRGLSVEHGNETVYLNQSEQMRMCGNSVCPDMARALVSGNFKIEKGKL